MSEESSVHHACRKLGDAFKNNGQHWKELKESSERVQQDLITFYNKVGTHLFVCLFVTKGVRVLEN